MVPVSSWVGYEVGLVNDAYRAAGYDGVSGTGAPGSVRARRTEPARRHA